MYLACNAVENPPVQNPALQTSTSCHSSLLYGEILKNPATVLTASAIVGWSLYQGCVIMYYVQPCMGCRSRPMCSAKNLANMCWVNYPRPLTRLSSEAPSGSTFNTTPFLDVRVTLWRVAQR